MTTPTKKSVQAQKTPNIWERMEARPRDPDAPGVFAEYHAWKASQKKTS